MLSPAKLFDRQAEPKSKQVGLTNCFWVWVWLVAAGGWAGSGLRLRLRRLWLWPCGCGASILHFTFCSPAGLAADRIWT